MALGSAEHVVLCHVEGADGVRCTPYLTGAEAGLCTSSVHSQETTTGAARAQGHATLFHVADRCRTAARVARAERIIAHAASAQPAA